MNAYLTKQLSGFFGKYAVNVTIIPGSKAKVGNVVTVYPGKGSAVTNGNGARETTLYRQDLNGASMQRNMLHEAIHLIGSIWPFDHYYSSGHAQEGWEDNIMGDVHHGEVQERNIDEIIENARARENLKCGVSCSTRINETK